MNSLTKWRPLLVALIVLVCVGLTPVMRYVFCWDVSTVASVWVAIGTSALALVTWWSVLQTRKVIAGEDRRHQQSFVPIVKIDEPPRIDIYGWASLWSANAGRGPALAVRARLTGWVFATFYSKSGNRDQNYSIDHLVFEISVASTGSRTDDHFNLIARDDNLKQYDKIDIKETVISAAEIEYCDLFGNKYKTIYDDFGLKRFHIEQPEHLRIPADA